MGYIPKTLAAILALLFVVILFFTVSANIRVTKTRQEAALIIWGESDSVIPLNEGEYLQSILPDAELVTMEGVNHIPHVEDPERFIEIVLEFLD